MSRNIINNSKGFSLIELMVVVAIIGILAAVGIPQYAKFQARTRQGEAKTTLSSVFVAQQGFFQEWNCYVSDLRNAGAGVSGVNLRYVAGFDPGILLNPAGCNTGVPPHSGANYSLTDGNGTAAVAAFISPGATWAAGLTVAVLRTTVAANDVAPTATAFTAAAVGDPKSTVGTAAAGDTDIWTVNQLKQISNIQIRL